MAHSSKKNKSNELSSINTIYAVAQSFNTSVSFVLLCIQLFNTKKFEIIDMAAKSENIDNQNLNDMLLVLKECSLIQIHKKKSKSTDKDDKEKEITAQSKEVIQHLIDLSGKKMRITDKKIKIVSRHLKKGFTVKDCKGVNIYFAINWKKDPIMSKYYRIETIYNGDFEKRYEEAWDVISRVIKHQKNIFQIVNGYMFVYKNIIGKDPSDIQDFFAKSSELQGAIISPESMNLSFWMEEGYSPEDIMYTIAATIDSWSKKPEIKNKISLERITDLKFRDRHKIAMNKKESFQSRGISGWLNQYMDGTNDKEIFTKRFYIGYSKNMY